MRSRDSSKTQFRETVSVLCWAGFIGPPCRRSQYWQCRPLLGSRGVARSRDFDVRRGRRRCVDGAAVNASTSAVTAAPLIVRSRRLVASLALQASVASANVTFFCCNRRRRVGSSLSPIIILSRISESSSCSKAQDFASFLRSATKSSIVFSRVAGYADERRTFRICHVDFTQPVFIECFLDLLDLVPIGVVVEVERSEDGVRC